MNKFAVIMLAVFSAAACGQLKQHASSQDGDAEDAGPWGHLTGSTDHWLVQLGPDQTVSVCGPHSDAAAKAIRQWARSAGRSSLKVDATCNRQADRVVVISDTTTASVKRACDKQPEVAGIAIVEYSAVLLCVDNASVDEILLHEAGHLWGLCDVYPLPAGFADNCDPAYFSGRSRSTVMGANYSMSLAGGDIAGVERLAGRGDLGGNSLWQKDETAPTLAQSFSGNPLSDHAPARRFRDLQSDVMRAEDVPVELIEDLLNF